MEIYYMATEYETLKIIQYAYDKFGIDELKQYNRYGELKENNISKAIRKHITVIGQDEIIKLIQIAKNRKDFINRLRENPNK